MSALGSDFNCWTVLGKILSVGSPITLITGFLSQGAGGASLRSLPSGDFCPLKFGPNNIKINITIEICITIDFASPKKNSWKKARLRCASWVVYFQLGSL